MTRAARLARGTTAMAAAVAVLGACAPAKPAGTTSTAAASAVPIAVAASAQREFAQRIEVAGTLSAVRRVNVGAVAAGRIVSVAVRVGDRVQPGETLAQIDPAAYAAGFTGAQAGAEAASANHVASASALAAARAGIDGAGAQMAMARSRAALARTTAARMAALYAQGAISRQQNDETQSALAAANAGVAAAQAGYAGAQSGYSAALAQSQAAAASARAAEANVAAAGVPLSETTLSSPFAGIVTAKFVAPGAVVGPGAPVVTVEDPSDLELDVAVSNDDVASVAPGATVPVRIDALGTRSISGRVRAIVPSQDPSLRSAIVKIALDRNPALLPGMYARVTISAGAHVATGVPLAALVSRAGQSGVFIVKGSTATFVPVEAGTIDGAFVEVRGIGATPVNVVVGNVQSVTDGAAVTVARS